MNQAELRIRTDAIIADYGTKQAFICKHTGIRDSDFTKFLRYNMDLRPEQSANLDKFLSVRGYSDAVKAFESVLQGAFAD